MLDLYTLNPEQRIAVQTIKGPVLILAGAGTGKTRVITYRIGHMVERGIPPGNILAVTFTNKAAREMQERVGKIIPKKPKASKEEKPERPTISTFHSLCVRILRKYIELLGYKSNFVIYDETEQLATVKKIMSSISAKGEKTDPHVILSLISKFKSADKSTSIMDEGARALAQHVLRKYQSSLRACNAVDFDDLILLTLQLFKEHPEALEGCRQHFQYIMVDEYQDTNASQFQLVYLLSKEHRNLCVVGDDDQSIYGWRGAEIANLLELEKYFPEVKVVKLEQNYRSTSVILKAANAVIKNNARRRGKHLWSEKGEGNKILLQHFPEDEEEARTIVERIEYNRMAHKIPWTDHAILFRTNLQSRPLETALRKANVRYNLIGGQSFFDRREIKDFLAFLKMFINPHDDVNLLRIANVPARGLSDVTMERLVQASHERSASVYTAMRHTDIQDSFMGRTKESIQAFLAMIEEEKSRIEKTTSISQWADNFLSDIDYFNELRRGEKNVETAENRVRNLKDIIITLDKAEPINGNGFERLQTFLEDTTLDNDRRDEKESTVDAVTLITMHSCKGLEFPHVFIVGLEDGLLPHTRSKVEGTLDEERRLFYVAITRAMQSLMITHCGGRKKYGQMLPCHPSPFLKELPPELLDVEDGNSKKIVTAATGKSFFDAMRNAAS
ncbi:MAG: rep [Verrucomicrobiales bacterium]|nr:rep [Verrucomicrobiales bacterium]